MILINNILLRRLKLCNIRISELSSIRCIGIIPSIYDGEPDPAPKFFSKDVQVLLKRLTRPDFSKVFRKRTNHCYDMLKSPKYKFLTNKELEAEMARAQRRADELLQMPPVLKVHQPLNDVLSMDTALTGYDTAKYIFTDISFGVSNEHRIIVERDTDGTLRSSDHTVRKRLNQVYFPIIGRNIREPLMFTDEEKLNSLLNKEHYEFLLDRACLQYEPDEPTYQKITSITYQHVDSKRNYQILRSTRHFGPMAFYLNWHRTMDGLLLELLQTEVIREAVCLLALRQIIHGDLANKEESMVLSQEILRTPIQLQKPERVTEEDIQLDQKCIDCVDKYISNNSAIKSQQELALQGLRESYQELIELSRSLKKAHGN